MIFRTKFLAVFAALLIYAFPLLAVNPVINGQTIFSDAAPTISNCGSSPSAATGGTSNGATITVGAATTNAYGVIVPVLQCTLTFATPFTNPPVVGLSVYQTGGPTARIASLSTTVMLVYFSSNAAGATFSFVAF